MLGGDERNVNSLKTLISSAQGTAKRKPPTLDRDSSTTVSALEKSPAEATVAPEKKSSDLFVCLKTNRNNLWCHSGSTGADCLRVVSSLRAKYHTRTEQPVPLHSKTFIVLHSHSSMTA